jgi:hypothetical protein
MGVGGRKRLNEQLLANLEKQQSNCRYGSNNQSSASQSESYLQELENLTCAAFFPPKMNEEPTPELKIPELKISELAIPEVAMAEAPIPEVNIQEAEEIEKPCSETAKALIENLNREPALAYNRPTEISRTERGTIEFVVQDDGRTLTPFYNKCGMITGLDLGDGTSLHKAAGSESWYAEDNATTAKADVPIKSVAFDKLGNLLIATTATL